MTDPRRNYAIAFDRRAAKEFAGLEKREARRVRDAIRALSEDPHPPGSIKLSGVDDLFRIRIGDYRVIYSVDDGILTVLVVRVAHRREVYRRR
ncbi:type II toxin-antitoxin system RelE/ParE family toxin [Schumannella sp. 10F1B-5-1]|uniref:type II toxin-antitoxin system RelE family toxin n=1 Tax=Schumannella sp. 10F1B-5-1 TaxID=2590780 RepID=UPI00113244A9|nr:type II toxin-antitoxin system RelE/ParE family toxin [Schumannella sp. 10F1B-5-1]TPW76893.1 type II toxin-antitoxin system RelE/ParE family toxin [Schumannella sp. 10F1B-5-1]